MSTKLIWTPVGAPSISAITFEADVAAARRLLTMQGVADVVATTPYTSKSPGQQGETALDLTVPSRIVSAQALLQESNRAALWANMAEVARSFAQQPVRFGESLELGLLTLQRDGLDDREIDAIARSIATDFTRAPGIGTCDAEWLCPYPWWRDTADTMLDLGISEGLNLRSLDAQAIAADSASYGTGSVTLKAGRLYLIAVTNTKATTPDTVTISNGATWTQVNTQIFNTIATPTQRISLFRGVPSSDYTGTLLISHGGAVQTSCSWNIIEVIGADVSRADQGVRQSTAPRYDSTTNPTATLAALLGTSSGVFGAMAKNTTTAVAPGTGFTELADVNEATPAASLETEWRNGNDTTVDCSWTGAAAAAMIGIEIVPYRIAVNSGDVDAPLLARLYGAATAVTLTNNATGEAFTVTVTLADGDYLEVNTTPGQKSIEKVSGATRTNLMSGLDLTSPRLFSIRPGNTSISFTATGADAQTHAELFWRNRYGGVA